MGGIDSGRRRHLLAGLAAVGLAVLLATPASGLRDRSRPTHVGPIPDHPVAREMSVFTTPRTEADALPPEQTADFGDGFTCDPWSHEDFGGCMGRLLPAESRLLLSDLGARRTRLWAYPTDTGAVCWAWGEGGGGSCVIDLVHQGQAVDYAAIGPDRSLSGSPIVVVGIAPDAVVQVDVTVAGVSVPALLGRNGFFYELSGDGCVLADVEAVTATFTDGHTMTSRTGWDDVDPPASGLCRP